MTLITRQIAKYRIPDLRYRRTSAHETNLMGELAKVKRTLAKCDETARHEMLLVVDATTGGNALRKHASFIKPPTVPAYRDETRWLRQRRLRGGDSK